MTSKLEHLRAPLLLDGGMGTALLARGLDPSSESSSSWNLRRPAVVRSVHEGFVEAGADVIVTNTFTANPWQAKSGELEEVEASLREGVVLARAQRRGDVIVSGNIGPTGALPPPEGNADLDELEVWFERQAALLVKAGADWISIETLYHPKEARAAVRGARRASRSTPLVASMACRRIAGDFKTVTGLSWKAVLRAIEEEGADAVGANCSLTPDEMAPLIEAIGARTTLPIFAKPTVAADGGAPLYPGEFAEGLVKLVGAGALAVGGCCGTSAADLAAARVALDQIPRSRPSQATQPFGCVA